MSVATISGIAVGAISALCVIVFVIYYFRRPSFREKVERSLSKMKMSIYSSKNNLGDIPKAYDNSRENLFSNEMNSLFEDTHNFIQFKAKDLIFDEDKGAAIILGSGSYGIVKKGKIKLDRTPIAIKELIHLETMNQASRTKYLQMFKSEVGKMMVIFGVYDRNCAIPESCQC